MLIRNLRRSHKKTKTPLKIPTPLPVQDLEIPSFVCHVTREEVKQILNAGNFSHLVRQLNSLTNIENKIRNKYFSTIRWDSADYDIRSIWEPARLQHLTVLLAYWVAHPDDPVSKNIKTFCLSAVLNWIDSNPFLFGPHYISVMECALRIPVLFYCLKKLDDLQTSQARKILETLYAHAWWVAKRLSLYSSLGNHTIAEAVGLIFAGAIFSDLNEGQKWFNKGTSILEHELPHQILDDGGPAEQSLNYHRFVLDLYWLVINFLKKNELYDCQKLKPPLVRAEEWLMQFQGNDHKLPSIGDSDDGFAIAPGILPPKPTIHTDQTRIRIFKKSGYTIIHTNPNTQLIFDHGPLGMAPFYNHGHADALSITLNKNGMSVLVDPGTYRYNEAAEWRRYFKGTRAHNTVTIDGCDQAIQETGFIWSHPYRVDLVGFSENEDRFSIHAVHDGYTRLKEPVWHERALLLIFDSCFLIKDSFRGSGLHEFELNFHIHPSCDLNEKNGWWQIGNPNAQIYLRFLKDHHLKPINGQKNPIRGLTSADIRMILPF
jgi:hypothetical protein